MSRYLSIYLYVCLSCHIFCGDAAQHRQTSYDIARLLLMAPIDPWRNSTPVFGAAALCATKIDDFRASSMLSSLTTWLKRPLRKDQLGGTFKMHCTSLSPFFMIEGGDGGSRYSHSVEAVARKGRASLPAKVGIPHFFFLSF